jgi:hypothetical protein
MPKVAVTHYRIEWNAGKSIGTVHVKIGTGDFKPVPIDSAEEFVAVMLMMSKSNVLFDTDTKDFEVGPRPVGT